MAWVYLLIAGCLEVIGVILMNEWSRTKHKIFILLIGIAFVCSFSTLKLSMIDIPMGTAYAIWTGIGTAGGTMIGMIFYHESKNIMRILCILLILGSVIGLRLIN
ncbi:multidrug efflux SMR transporter [Staphylococcus warneri]|uniref:Multidrug efflux SMR transporter n=3 Tax=Staphylococcus TaxID=1279 RepID=A0A364URZ8_STAWA|nr:MULTISPECIES: multidrug efflux SMR transporter [Staphylococcus]PAK72758.1 QacE family quaternary ammonium compound efflux SMR transporter [Staphylococcus pasteuri]SKR87383.1 Putative multidrug resistance protein [Mycobacteroides abscessus subsp. abscessus]AGC89929.1 sugE protein [Staphylococcus warneri SG1]AXZ22762.1 QacE family quaternary ammonium compound efflux SMR transporter [Staphylococcus warneri]EGG97917.1 multidrug resistance protein, SMR family [Staphylococcus warneri VCU121]